jgi:arylsulfatase A-like enzyme
MPISERPNILLITADQQRFDTLGVNGNDWVKTPHLDRLASRGVSFSQAHVQGTICVPSRACIQTGRYAHQHGVNYMEWRMEETPGLPPGETTFMERLQTSGYHTAAFGYINTPAQRGFDEMQLTGSKGERWIYSSGMEIGAAPLGPDYAAWLEKRHPGGYEKIYEQRRHPDYRKYMTAIRNVLPMEEYIDSWTGQNTVDFLQRSHSRPFFAWCGFCGPHGPMDPPAPYADMYSPERIPFTANYHLDMQRRPRSTTQEQDALARRYYSHYYGLVSLLDEWVGRMVAALEQRGLLDNTLILYTADHGEMLFDFGRTGKALFYEPVTRVPPIIAPPSPAGGAKAVRHDDGLAEVFDIAPTILDYAGAKVPKNLAASSLRPRLEGHAPGKSVVLSEYVSNDRDVRGACLRSDHGKYIQWTDNRGDEFYDMEHDPLERRNLIADPAARESVEQHRRLLIERLIATGHRC